MMSAYDAAGKRNSSKTHARHGERCEFCDRMAFGNGGRVAHARSHVRRGEAVELVKFASEGTRRAFVSPSDTATIARLMLLGYEHG